MAGFVACQFTKHLFCTLCLLAGFLLCHIGQKSRVTIISKGWKASSFTGNSFKQTWTLEFPGVLVGLGSNTVTTVALVTAVAQLQSLAWELPHPKSAPKKEDSCMQCSLATGGSACREGPCRKAPGPVKKHREPGEGVGRNLSWFSWERSGEAG